jgi:hypothetical protein
VILHFAYGSNMSRLVMRRHAPGARPLGAAQLAGYRFVITADGYASVVRAPAQVVHGVAWRLTARDRVTLDAWENAAAGLYRCESLPVRVQGRRARALVYVARHGGEGRAKPGYVELVTAAAREWDLPAGYVRALELWLPPRPAGAGPRKLGGFG